MSPRDFVYWLNGYLELTGKRANLTRAQVRMIQKHLALVMKNETAKPETKAEASRSTDVRKLIESVRSNGPSVGSFCRPGLIC